MNESCWDRERQNPHEPGTLNWWAAEVSELARAKGFECPGSLDDVEGVLAKLMLVTTEVAEAAEAAREDNEDNFLEELADVLIRVLDICGTMGIDIEGEVHAKHGKNMMRPYRHGKRA